MSNRSPIQIYRRRIAMLERRIDHLRGRISDYKGKDASYDKLELKSLVWALETVVKNPDSALDIIKMEVPSDSETTDTSE
jgi:hypothetical protein